MFTDFMKHRRELIFISLYYPFHDIPPIDCAARSGSIQGSGIYGWVPVTDRIAYLLLNTSH